MSRPLFLNKITIIPILLKNSKKYKPIGGIENAEASVP
jgi:hypothetical protein